MKVLQKRKLACGNHMRYAKTERNVLSHVSHPYIVSMQYAFQTTCHLVLVLQFCPNGNLQQLIGRQTRLPESIARLYSAQLLLALCHLHALHIVYRDLKPDNVVLDEQEFAMLTDFGLSKQGVIGLHGTKTFCGSPKYLAPEIILRRGHGHTVDIYGLGVLLFNMVVGQSPFYHPDRETLINHIKYAHLVVPPIVSEGCTLLIKAMMERDPSKRLGAKCSADVQGHVFFAEMDWAALMRREVPFPSNVVELKPKSMPISRQRTVDNLGPFKEGKQAPRDSVSDVAEWNFPQVESVSLH